MKRNESVEFASQELASWTNALSLTVEDALAQVKETMQAVRLPQGCPSHAAMAEMCLRGPKKKLREVQAALKDLEEAIYFEAKQ